MSKVCTAFQNVFNYNSPMSSSNPWWSFSIINVKKCRFTPSPNAASPVFNRDYIQFNNLQSTNAEDHVTPRR